MHRTTTRSVSDSLEILSLRVDERLVLVVVALEVVLLPVFIRVWPGHEARLGRGAPPVVGVRDDVEGGDGLEEEGGFSERVLLRRVLQQPGEQTELVGRPAAARRQLGAHRTPVVVEMRRVDHQSLAPRFLLPLQRGELLAPLRLARKVDGRLEAAARHLTPQVHVAVRVLPAERTAARYRRPVDGVKAVLGPRLQGGGTGQGQTAGLH